MEALLRETCNARMRAEPHGCILLNLSLHLALQQSVALFNELWEQKLIKQLQLLFATTLKLTLRHSDVIIV